MEQQETIDYCLKWIRRIRDEQTILNSDREEALKFYRSDPSIVPFIEGRSKATTTDMMDAVEWAKPSLLEIFTTGDEATSLQPVSKEDVEAVEKQGILVNHQLKVRNKWFMVLHDWFDDMMKLKIGAVKYQWHKKIEHIDKDYVGLSDMQYQAKLQEPNISILVESEREIDVQDVDPLSGMPIMAKSKLHDVTFRYTIEDEYPLIEAIPSEEFGFPISTREIGQATFCFHRVSTKKAAFIKEYSKKQFEEIQVTHDMYDMNEVTKERFADLGGKEFFYNKDKEEFYVYECYYENDDGEPTIVTLCGDNILKEEENQYGKPPFHVITPVKMAHRISGYSFYDLLREIQRIRTALLRQILDNVYFANNRRYFVDPEKINVDDFLNNNFSGAVIRTTGDPNVAVHPEEKAPLPPEVFSFWELLNVEKDYHSGVPRSFQGVNPKALNETWRGQSQQVNQAAQRIAMMARLIAEMGIAPLVSDVVNMNIKFLKKATAIRFMNDWIDISPDNIIGRYDVIVNVGTGTSNKDQNMGYLQQLLGLYGQVFKAGIGVVTNQNVYNAMRELVKTMGFKNTGDFVTDPRFTDAVRGLVMLLIQSGAMQNPNIGGLLQQVASGIGLTPEALQAISAQTFNNQKTPEQPKQPTQPIQPQITQTGGGYYS